MDPNTTLANIQRELDTRETSHTVDGMVCDLATWIDSGGFEPDWTAHPLAASYFRTRVARANRCTV